MPYNKSYIKKMNCYTKVRVFVPYFHEFPFHRREVPVLKDKSPTPPKKKNKKKIIVQTKKSKQIFRGEKVVKSEN